jgi:2-oxoglutarate dehydrogenase E1 component
MVMDFGLNAGLVEELYAQYLENPESVDASWRKLFEQRALAAPAPRFFGGYVVPSAAPAANGGAATNGGTATGHKPSATNGGNGHATAVAREVEAAFQPSSGLRPSIEPAPVSARIVAPVDRSVLEAASKARVIQLINAYRVRGHFYADLDPLSEGPTVARVELALSNFGLSEDDLDKDFPTADLAGLGPVATLREIIAHLEETYCRTIGVEYTQIEDL